MGPDGPDFASALEELLQHPSEDVRRLAETVLQGVDGLHRQGLGRIAGLLDHHGLLEQAVADPAAGDLLDLYDLVPRTPEQQVERALEAIRPYIHSHGGQLEVVSVIGGTVAVRLAGACSGCSGSALTLRRGVEAALRDGYPAFQRIEVVEPVAAEEPRPTFIPLGEVRRIEPAVRPVFEDAAALEEVIGMKVVRVGGEEVLLHNLGGEIFAYRRGGASHDSFPVAIQDGRVKVAVNVPAEAPLPR